MLRIAVWGDGAVGTALACALSGEGAVLLIGPPGSGSGRVAVESLGVFRRTATVEHSESSGPMPRSDISFLAVKAQHIGEVARAARECSGVVACLSNGMGLERAWGCGWDAVEKCVVVGGFETLARFRVRMHPGGFLFGTGGTAGRLLASSGLEVREVADIDLWRWAKWLVNSSLNPVAALSGLANDELAPAGLEPLVRMLALELEDAVPEEKRAGAAREAGAMLDFLLARSHNRCSMLQDLDSGRTTEIDFMTGLAAGMPGHGHPLSAAVTALVESASGGAAPGR
jgi:2-dehydropantoate 2-reductase